MSHPRRGLVLFAMSTCGPCKQAAQWLDGSGVAYQKILVDNDATMISWLEQSTRQKTVPQFFFNGRWVEGGLPEVKAAVAQGLVPKRNA